MVTDSIKLDVIFSLLDVGPTFRGQKYDMKNRLKSQKYLFSIGFRGKSPIPNIMVTDSIKLDIIFLLLGTGSTFGGQK